MNIKTLYLQSFKEYHQILKTLIIAKNLLL